MSRYEIDKNADARAVPKRIALIRRETSARIELPGDEKLPTAPALLIRELVLFQVVVVFLALMALFFDAPLEDLADPYNTPNPAKAPWYFLGLQELLHYFPPVVAGVVLPGLVVIAVVAIPYFRVNWDVQGFLECNSRIRMVIMTSVVMVGSVVLWLFHAWPVVLCTLIIYTLLLVPLFPFCPWGTKKRLIAIPLSDWIMTWFVLNATVLTVIGVFFRGPGWSWIWPWATGGQP